MKSPDPTKQFARTLRRASTEVEKKLWRLLRDRRLAGAKFRRQVPIGPYVADFVCMPARLVVELDGSQHLHSEHDVKRDAWLAADGYRVLRIWNSELNNNEAGVLEAIWQALRENTR